MSDFMDFISEVGKWLEKPVETTIKASLEKSVELNEALQRLMQSNSADKKMLGSLIGRVKSTQKNLQSLELADWVSIYKGFLAIGHRPSAKLVADLKLQNASHILTLLSENEGSRDIKILSDKSGMGWLWFPMQSAGFPSEERYQELVTLFKEMKNILEDGGKIYIHCSAGIHRTGMITFAFLRFIGLSREEAQAKLAELRPTTSDGVGEDRMEWGNSVYQKLRNLG